VARCGAADAAAVVAEANAAQKPWKRLDARSRAAALHRLADSIQHGDVHDVAVLMVREMGKPYPEATGELANCAGIFRYYAEMARDEAGKIAGTTQAGSFQYARYEPYGVSVLDGRGLAGRRQRLHREAGGGDLAVHPEVHGALQRAGARLGLLRHRRGGDGAGADPVGKHPCRRLHRQRRGGPQGRRRLC
jgi:hypothetical protein